LLCKKVNVTKSKEVKTGCNLAESCKEGCGSKRGCFANVMAMNSKEIVEVVYCRYIQGAYGVFVFTDEHNNQNIFCVATYTTIAQNARRWKLIQFWAMP
jgi:hypothetical protein